MVWIHVSRAARLRLALLAALLCVSAAAGAPVASAAVSPRATVARSVRIGTAPPAQPLLLVLPLTVNSAGLARFANAVSTPGSGMYGHYLSVPALARRFGAPRAQGARVVSFLREHGATNVRVDATGLLAEATMSAHRAERLFAAPLAQYRAPDHARYLAPTAAVRVPAPLRGLVDGVVGLDTQPLAAPATVSLDTARRTLPDLAPSLGPSPAAGAQPTSALTRTGTPQGCPAGVAAGAQDNNPGFTPNQYLTAFDFDPLHNAGLAGQGERVALIEIDGYNPNDLTVFAQCFGLRLPPVNPYGVLGVKHQLPQTGEATLDLEILDAAAPDLRAIDVYEAHSNPAETLAAFAAPLQTRGRMPQVISASFGLCEADAYQASGVLGIEASERVLEVAAAAGASVLAATGDNGSADCQALLSNQPIDALAINYPASSRWVTAVGGTNISLTTGNQIASEPVWNDTSVATAAGGGGVSGLFSRPSYQNGVVTPNRREIPDVSMLADLLPGYAIYCSATPVCVDANNPSPWLTVGGTSAATPLLAGGVAIVDEMLRAAHHENLGLLNPLLYELGGSSAASGVFDDVTSIGNDIGPYIHGGNGQPLGCCTAKVGYDDASGWGSVAVAALAQQALQLVPPIIPFALAVPGHQRPVARHELLADISCSAACSVFAFAQVRIGRAKPFSVNSRLYTRGAGRRATIPIKFSPHELRQLRSALAHHRRIVGTIYGVLVDQLGAIEHRSPGQSIRIPS